MTITGLEWPIVSWDVLTNAELMMENGFSMEGFQRKPVRLGIAKRGASDEAIPAFEGRGARKGNRYAAAEVVRLSFLNFLVLVVDFKVFKKPCQN